MTSLLATLLKETSGTAIGFDRMFASLAEVQSRLSQNYPYYNISKLENNKYMIELAVAGFGKQDIEVLVEGDALIVSGSIADKDDASSVIFNGLSKRSFTKKFAISNRMVVHGASLTNGILKIVLEQLTDEKKSKKIEIEDEASTVTEFAARNPVLLTEEDREGANGKLM